MGVQTVCSCVCVRVCACVCGVGACEHVLRVCARVKITLKSGHFSLTSNCSPW